MLRILLLSLFVSGCGDQKSEEQSLINATHAESLKRSHSDFPDTFNRNLIMSDRFFTNSDYVDAAGIQKFLENTPYKKRSFLADMRLSNGQSVAEALHEIALLHEINPMALLARMQIEKSLVAKTRSPGGNAVDFAFGCGCHDYKSCNENMRGLKKQMECGAETYRKWFNRSTVDSGIYNKGDDTKSSLDPLKIVPQNHATASLYSYTPWVLEGRGGSWMTWVITRLYAMQSDDLNISSRSSGDSIGVNHYILKYRDGFSDAADKNEDVKELQKMLNALNYDIQIDGYYGDETVAVVTLFQEDFNLRTQGQYVNQEMMDLLIEQYKKTIIDSEMQSAPNTQPNLDTQKDPDTNYSDIQMTYIKGTNVSDSCDSSICYRTAITEFKLYPSPESDEQCVKRASNNEGVVISVSNEFQVANYDENSGRMRIFPKTFIFTFCSEMWVNPTDFFQ